MRQLANAFVVVLLAPAINRICQLQQIGTSRRFSATTTREFECICGQFNTTAHPQPNARRQRALAAVYTVFTK